jgi:hypothetical protein
MPPATDKECESSTKREQELLAMFNEAAVTLTREDLVEREFLLGSFAGTLSQETSITTAKGSSVT